LIKKLGFVDGLSCLTVKKTIEVDLGKTLLTFNEIFVFVDQSETHSAIVIESGLKFHFFYYNKFLYKYILIFILIIILYIYI